MSDGAGDARPEPKQRAVSRRRRRADFGLLGRRAIAAVIDLFCVAIAASIAAAGLAAAAGVRIGLGFTLSLIVVWLVYDVWLVGGGGQATLGQRAMGIELASADGATIGRLQAAIWSFVFLAGIAISGGLTLLFPLADASGRGVNDALAAVRVGRRRPAETPMPLAEHLR